MINLWEVDVVLVFQNSLSTLLPFVPILKGGNDTSIIRQAAEYLQQNEKLSELEPLLGFFASFVLESELVRQILRWDMVVLRESPWYQQLQQESKLDLVFRLLVRRVGELPPNLKERLRTLSLSQVENLAEALLDFSEIGDLVIWLDTLSKQ